MALKRHPLSSGWEVKLQPQSALSENGGETKATPAEERWIRVEKVPTEIHSDLFKNGIIPHPHLDLNELAVRWVAEQEWTYRCRFDSWNSPDSRRDGAPETSQTKTDIVFQGLDTFATVWLNGEKILTSDNMFIEHRVHVKHLLQQMGNELLITFDSARKRGLELVQSHPEHRFIVHQTEVSRGPVRKAQYQWGWDWGPILLTCGPWKPVLLETYATRIDEMRVAYRLAEDLGRAEVTVSVQTQGPTEASMYELLLDGEPVPYEVELKDESLAEFKFAIDKPRLWWPRIHGRQELYEVQLKVISPDLTGLLDSATKTFGLRRAELIKEEDASGESFYFRINGVDVFCGGSCWIPADSFLTTITPSRYEDWVTDHIADGNQAMIRVWGGGIYEDDSFFDACDRSGVLVWQDFAFACANYPAYPPYLESVETEARQNVRRLRHHPSLIIWAGNNEDYQIVERYNLNYDYEGDKDPSSWLKTDFPARYIYEYLLPSIIDEESPGTIYHPSSPWGNGTSTTLKVDPRVGDVHQWDVWHGAMQPYQRLPGMGGRFVSEFGMEAYPHVSTTEGAVTDRAQRRPGSMVMDFRNKAVGHARRTLAYVGDNVDLRVGVPSGSDAPTASPQLEWFTYLTQVVQADAMAWAYKGWRRRWGDPGHRRCGGVLAWQLNDCWPTVSWSVVDYNGVRKLAWYAIRDAMRPVAVGVSRVFRDWTSRPADGGLWQRDTGHVDPRAAWRDVVYDVWVANSTVREHVGRVTVRYISIKTGDVLGGVGPLDVKVLPNGTTQVLSQRKAEVVGASGLSAGDDDRRPFHPVEEDPFVIHVRLEVEVEGVIRLVQDVSWPEPLKYLSFEDRGVKVRYGEDGKFIVVATRRPVKAFVVLEKPGIKLSMNGFDVMPGEDVRVGVEGIEFGNSNLLWVYFGQESVVQDL